jgi:hypothetical protein
MMGLAGWLVGWLVRLVGKSVVVSGLFPKTRWEAHRGEGRRGDGRGQRLGNSQCRAGGDGREEGPAERTMRGTRGGSGGKVFAFGGDATRRVRDLGPCRAHGTICGLLIADRRAGANVGHGARHVEPPGSPGPSPGVPYD